jgi:hypothetical protein
VANGGKCQAVAKCGKMWQMPSGGKWWQNVTCLYGNVTDHVISAPKVNNTSYKKNEKWVLT